MVLAVLVLFTAGLVAQQTSMEITRGKVIRRVGQTLVVQVLEGPDRGNHRFTFTSDSPVKITDQNGEEISVFDIKAGMELFSVRIGAPAPPESLTDAEVAELTALGGDSLPKTAGSRRMMALAGLVLLGAAALLRWRRTV